MNSNDGPGALTIYDYPPSFQSGTLERPDCSSSLSTVYYPESVSTLPKADIPADESLEQSSHSSPSSQPSETMIQPYDAPDERLDGRMIDPLLSRRQSWKILVDQTEKTDRLIGKTVFDPRSAFPDGGRRFAAGNESTNPSAAHPEDPRITENPHRESWQRIMNSDDNLINDYHLNGTTDRPRIINAAEEVRRSSGKRYGLPLLNSAGARPIPAQRLYEKRQPGSAASCSASQLPFTQSIPPPPKIERPSSIPNIHSLLEMDLSNNLRRSPDGRHFTPTPTSAKPPTTADSSPVRIYPASNSPMHPDSGHRIPPQPVPNLSSIANEYIEPSSSTPTTARGISNQSGQQHQPIVSSTSTTTTPPGSGHEKENQNDLRGFNRPELPYSPTSGSQQYSPNKRSLNLRFINSNGRFKKPSIWTKSQRQQQVDTVPGCTSTSVASTPSEFILVPKSYYSASTLPRKTISTNGDSVSQQEQEQYGSQYSLPYHSSTANGNRCCTLSRLCWIAVFIVGFFGISSTAGLLIWYFTRGPTVFRFEYRPLLSDSPTDVTVELIPGGKVGGDSEDMASITLQGEWPYQNMNAMLSFQARKIAYVDGALPQYCFLSHLNESVGADFAEFQSGLQNAFDDPNPPERVVWPKRWNLVRQQLAPSLRADFLGNMNECRNSRYIVFLKYSKRDNYGSDCRECSNLCFPEFDLSPIERETESHDHTIRGKPYFHIRGHQCIWIRIPEWAEYSADQAHLRSGLDRLKPTVATSLIDHDDWITVQPKIRRTTAKRNRRNDFKKL